jgi:GTP diphosphokinase / guanosine-3',5'-bis(diphosphate) 3'-diphosphatase
MVTNRCMPLLWAPGPMGRGADSYRNGWTKWQKKDWLPTGNTKEGKESSGFDVWLAGIREILENPDLNVVDFIDHFSLDIYKDETFVFTPKGDLKKMPAGSTLLDFAYEIHSQLGDKCVGGKVNGKKVTLKYKLKNGDQVTIETSNSQKPKMDWLDFLVTSKAISRVKASLNEEKKKPGCAGPRNFAAEI